METFRIADLPPQKRPREKLLAHSAEFLTDRELLAAILGRGTRKESVIALVQRLVANYGMKGLASERHASRLAKHAGISPLKACQIVAAFELGRRFLTIDAWSRDGLITSPDDAWRVLKEMGALKKEQLRGLYLNTRNRVIHEEIISVGTVNLNLIHPREVFYPAVQYLASSVILAHNHPSGDTSPSDEDIKVTAELKEAAKIMGIELTDHLIIAHDAYTSMKERGLL